MSSRNLTIRFALFHPFHPLFMRYCKTRQKWNVSVWCELRYTKMYLNSDSVDKLSDKKSDKKHVATVDTMRKKRYFFFACIRYKVKRTLKLWTVWDLILYWIKQDKKTQCDKELFFLHLYRYLSMSYQCTVM